VNSSYSVAWICVFALVSSTGAPVHAQGTTLVSVDSKGAAGFVPPSTAEGVTVALSEDGRWLAFSSFDPTLVPGDTNSAQDVFLRDLLSGTTKRVSVTSAGAQALGHSSVPALSHDGRYVAFQSTANNLVPNDPGFPADVFLHDQLTGETTCISVDPTGKPAGSLGFWWSAAVSISGDGRYVCFSSLAALVPDDTNQRLDVFVRDVQLGVTSRVSIPSGSGGQFLDADSYGGVISSDGQHVAWFVEPDSFPPGNSVYVRDLVAQQSTELSQLKPSHPCISADGRYVAYSQEHSGLPRHIVRYDTWASSWEPVSIDSAGIPSNKHSFAPRISPDGRIVAFTSLATNFGSTDGDWDVYVRDMALGQLTQVSVDTAGGDHGGHSGGESSYLALGMQGRLVAFASTSAGLVPDVTTERKAAYLHDREGGPSSNYCVSKVNSLGCIPRMSHSGSASASSVESFRLEASAIVNGVTGVMLYSATPNASPFQGGTLCVGPQVTRTPAQNSGGNSGPPDCSGTFLLEFNPIIQSGSDPLLQAGNSVFAQYWSRDVQSAIPSSLTDAVWFVILP
jgi:Tol biopolymer transport system component